MEIALLYMYVLYAVVICVIVQVRSLSFVYLFSNNSGELKRHRQRQAAEDRLKNAKEDSGTDLD